MKEGRCRLRSWVDSANAPDHPFPLNNLPCGVFSRPGEEPRCGVAIGDFVLDVAALEEEGILAFPGGPLLDVPFWNDVMEAGPEVWAALRARLIELLATGAAEQAVVEPHLLPCAGVTLHLPFLVAEYTDFYAGRHHATNVGTMFRGPENALPPNWLHIPIGYKRAGVLGRGLGHAGAQALGAGERTGPRSPRLLQPSRRFDIELEMARWWACPRTGRSRWPRRMR